MTLTDLQVKLQSRIENRCGTGPILEALVDPLEHARYEYGRYLPKTKAKTFNLPAGEVRVSLLDESGEPEDVVHIEGVYVRDPAPSTPLGQGFGAPLEQDYTYDAFATGSDGLAREMPSLYFIGAKYREAYRREVDYYRNHHEMIIVPPSSLQSVEGVVLYGVPHEWDELPRSVERLLLDRALVEFIDDHLVGDVGGLVRIPTPNGSFEFDGGRILLSLRDKLLDRFEGQLQSRMTGLTSG